MAADTEPPRSDALSVVLRQDMARLVRQLGVQSLRASVVEMGSMAVRSGWTLSESGEFGDSVLERSLDSVLPGAAAKIGELAQSSDEDTLVQRLSPRLWAFAWRLDAQHAAVTETQFTQRRDEVGDVDTALVRLLCNTGIRAGLMAPVGIEPDSTALVWPHVDRRAPRKPLRAAWAVPLLLVATVLLAAWLAFGLAPQLRAAALAQQQEVQRAQSLTDGTMAHELATALATGDYGEVQSALGQFQALGYFSSAAVANDRERIVALAGPTDPLRIGDAMAADYAATARPIDLRLGSERNGRLWLVAQPLPAAPTAQVAAMRVVAILTLLGAAGAAALYAWLSPRSRRRT